MEARACLTWGLLGLPLNWEASRVAMTPPDAAKSPVSRRNEGYSRVGYLVYF